MKVEQAYQLHLEHIKDEVSYVLLNDCLKTLQEVSGFLATEAMETQRAQTEANELLGEVGELLYRGGRL